jgi:hypothetical protein
MTAPTNSSLAVKQNGTDKAIVSPTVTKARELAQRIKYMIVNGNRLADAEVFALAQYSAANDLNPFAGECYYLPGTGPCPGIVGWRKKAQEQLNFEAAAQNETGAHMWTDDRPANIGEARFDPKAGDIAVVVTLHDFLSNKRWRQAYFTTLRELKALGYEQEEAKTEAKLMVGPEPVWTGIGVVFAGETFGKSEKFDRYERAKKRAEKVALRKRFPRVNLPEPVDADEDVIDVQYSDMDKPEETRSINQNLAELGFPPEPEKISGAPVGVASPEIQGYVEPGELVDLPQEDDPEDEQPTDTDPYADLKTEAAADPVKAFWHLQQRIGFDKKDAQAIITGCKGDMPKAFAALLRNAPPA